MKIPPLTAKLLLIGMVIVSIALFIQNQAVITKLRGTNQNLSVASQETKRLALENQQISRLRALNEEAEKLHDENRELPKLRNEVPQLRTRAKELKNLRAENERLKTVKKDSNNVTALAGTPPDFLPKSALRDAGLSSPEAAVQTVYWAMREGDLHCWSQSLVNGADRLQEDKDWQRKDLVEQMKHFTGFRIAHKIIVSSKEVELGLQSSVGGTIVPMFLKLIGSEWKLVD